MAVQSQSKINLSWTDNSDSETGFTIEHSTDGKLWAALASVDADITNYSDEGLDCEATWHYRVKAFNDCSESGYSDEAAGTTSACPCTVPVAPDTLNVVRSVETCRNLEISWRDNSNDENGFIVERKIEEGEWVLIADEPAGSGTLMV